MLSLQKEAQDESKTSICVECGNDLVHDKSYRLRSPYGEGWYCSSINKRCPSFGKVLDISLQKLKVKPRPVKGAISNLRDTSQEVMIDFIQEDKGIGLKRDMSYERYDPEPGEDERLKMEGVQLLASI